VREIVAHLVLAVIGRRPVVSALLLSFCASVTSAETVYRIRDINPEGSSFPSDFVHSGNVTFFTADDGVHGRELWRTDGTFEGTFLVKDILTGPSGFLSNMTDVAGTLFFTARESGLGEQLWKSDGTEAGTVLVRPLASPGSDASTINFTAAGGILFFVASSPATGRELWKSDGTAAGTVMVKDIAPGPIGSNPGPMVAFGPGVMFSARTPDLGGELWKSDGTAEGTVLVADIEPGPDYSSPLPRVVWNGRVYFSARTSTEGREVWATDGTAAGTTLLADIAPGEESSEPGAIALSNGALYWLAWEPSTGFEPYRSDGTAAGTARLADISPGAGSSNAIGFVSLGALTVFLAGDEETLGTHEIFRTDGTETGTQLVKDVNPGPTGPGTEGLAVLGNRVYFAANDGTVGSELWRTDGTEGRTRLVRDIWAGPEGGVGSVDGPGDRLVFVADDGESGSELWGVNGGAPEADAGPDQTVDTGVEVTLDGSGSNDPQGDPLTFQWRDASGTVLAITAAFTNTFPTGIHDITLVVSDGVNEEMDTVRIRVGRFLDLTIRAVEGVVGTVTAVPGGTCELAEGTSTTCTFAYEADETVQLTTSNGPFGAFGGWEGACAGTSSCTLTMSASHGVTARFVPMYTLVVQLVSQEAGQGAVRLDPPGDTCTFALPDVDFCERPYPQGSSVLLTALPAVGSVFVGWEHPACFGSTGPCTITIDDAPFVAAVFLGPGENQAPALSVTSPAPDESFVAPATVTLAADASDADGSIVSVEFFEGAIGRGIDTASPYSVAWSNVSAGVHEMTAVATDDRGATTTVSFTVTVSARVVPQADAYVRDGAPFANFGAANALHVRRASGNNNNRWTYLRFDVGALSSVTGARLRLFGHLVETVPDPVNAQVHSVASTTWNENAITWNSRPATGAIPIASVPLDISTTDRRWYEWDLTAYVQAEKAAGRNVISIAIRNDVVTSGRAAFRSRNANQNRPELLLTP
jgi:ELWxxDGT repeat protein